MRKGLIFFLLLASRLGVAQTIDISGTVKDNEGQPLHFAFVKDIRSKSAAYTDSSGNFTIKADPSSSLHINCFGYKDTVVNIESRTIIDVILRTAVNIEASKINNKHTLDNDIGFQQLSATMARDRDAGAGSGINPNNTIAVIHITRGLTIEENARANILDADPGAIFPQFNPKEETQGSRYFLKGWIHGYVVNSKDTVVQNPRFFFAYDKMGGGLLLTKNQLSAIEINRDRVKSFTLFDEANNPYTFENVPQINATHYVQVLASGDKYKIYKAIKTTFERDNYATDGVFEQGHNYDLYKDEYSYYVYDVKTNALQKIALKKKALKDAFAKDADKLSKFMTDHSSDTIDDFYLTILGAYMNE